MLTDVGVLDVNRGICIYKEKEWSLASVGLDDMREALPALPPTLNIALCMSTMWGMSYDARRSRSQDRNCSDQKCGICM